MTIQVDNALPPNVVEIGNEITQGVVDGLMSASPSASSVNPYVTQSLLNGKLSLTGGIVNGNVTFNNADGSHSFYSNADGFTFTGTSQIRIDGDNVYFNGGAGSHLELSNSGIQFADNSVQTTAAVAPTFATTAQAQAGTSTTIVVSPATLLDAKFVAGGRAIGYTTWTASTSGTGASAGTAFIKSINAPTSAIGFGQSYTAPQNSQRGQIVNYGIDFTKNIVFGGRFCRLQSGTVDSNSIFRCNLGRSVPLTTAGDLANRGVGIRIVGNTGALELQVHNGTSLFNVTSSFTPVYNQAFDVVITSNGAGVATLYVNGTSVATSSNAPTAQQGTNFSVILVECQNTAILTNSPMQMNCSDQFLHISPV